jgi:hypothetical protein
METNIHSMHEPAKIRFMVDGKGQIRAQRLRPYVATPKNGWESLEGLYMAQGFADGWAVFLEWHAAIVAGKTADQLPDEWLPNRVLDLRAEAANPPQWKAPKRTKAGKAAK